MSKSNGTKIELKEEDLKPILEQINKYYDGNVLVVTEWLDRAIFMLHFIPDDDEFSQLQKQNVCGVILGIKESLMQAYFQNQALEYEKFY
ncbi:MAG: hypothetical protein NXI10_15920 [bacterium]|nr:hypothetical protein [bacterium]